MKRFGYLYDKIISKENLLEAHNQAKKRKAYYKSVQQFERNTEKNIDNLHLMLKEERYQVKLSDYRHMKIVDKGKERDIYKLPYYPHRIVQWAIMLQIEHIFMNTFIRNTYSSIKKRGTHLALKHLNKALEDKDYKYCLKIDVSKFYPNIDNHILFEKLKRKFKDKRLLSLMEKITFSMGDKGQPIGSLWSQYAGNFYLSSLDHFCKENLSVKYYFRYCDDIVILSKDKIYLHFVLLAIEDYLNEELNLQLKSNYQIFPIKSRGIDFLGYKSFDDKVKLRRRNMDNLRKKLLRIKNKNILNLRDMCVVNSYLGFIKHCKNKGIFDKYFRCLNGKYFVNCFGKIEKVDLERPILKSTE